MHAQNVDAQILHEVEAVSDASLLDLLKETFVVVENRRRFFLIFMATLFSQWSGANAITQYSPTIFGYLGISGDESTFLATGIYGVVKFVSTLVFALFIVDCVGLNAMARERMIADMIGFGTGFAPTIPGPAPVPRPDRAACSPMTTSPPRSRSAAIRHTS